MDPTFERQREVTSAVAVEIGGQDRRLALEPVARFAGLAAESLAADEGEAWSPSAITSASMAESCSRSRSRPRRLPR